MSRDAALDALISAKVGGEPFATFFESGEGELFPDGTEESSGQVVTASDHVYFYWTGWKGDRLVLDVWMCCDEQAERQEWLDCDEYRDARRQVGLS